MAQNFDMVKNDQLREFIESLDQNQKSEIFNPFNDKRTSWHFLPSTMFDRKGLFIRELNKNQIKLLHSLLKSYLSQTGYEKTTNIMGLENVLFEMSGRSYRNPELYKVAFYGDPLKDDTWAWKFEGHHISLNFTIVNGKISYAPRFFGANPAEVPSGKQKGLRVLKKEEDIPLQLMASLNDAQLKKAIIQKIAYPEIISGNDAKAEPMEDAGIKVKELTIDQQHLISDIIMEYLSAMPQEIVSKRMQQVKESNFNEIRFAWAGGIGLHKPHYYRIQGHKFLIELDNTQNNANHVHSVWRDFDGDFGRDLIKEHYKDSDHHDH